MIGSGSTVQHLYGDYIYIVENHSGVSAFPKLWITAGCFLMVVSIFGTVVSNTESTILIITYAILLCVALVVHVAAGVSALVVGVGHSKEIVSDMLTAFVNSYEENTMMRLTMDWTQYKYQCCGNNGPEDWIVTVPYVTTTTNKTPTTPSENSTTTVIADTDKTVFKMPSSCCYRDSDYVKSQCVSYYTKGCGPLIQDAFSRNVMMASLLALGVALLDLFGAITAFMISKSIRRVQEIEADYSKLAMKSRYS